MKKIFYSLSLCVFSIANMNAQSISPSTLNTNGGHTVIGGNTYEWSIGEMVLVNTASAGTVVVTQGLLQPGKPSSGVGLNESQFIFDNVTVYPNPTENLFYLNADFKEKGEIHTLLYDMNGKIIDDKKVEANGQATKIPYNISMLAAGNYMLTVSFTPDNNKSNISKAAYKIEKTN